MTNKHPQPRDEIGVIELSGMENKLLLNMTGRGFSVAVCDPNLFGSEDTDGVTRIGG